MNSLAVSALVMAGITFYAGFYHMLIYAQQTRRRENFTFALTCFAVGLYAVSAAGLYSTTSVAAGAQWQRVQLIALALISAAFLWFTADYTSYKSKTLLYISLVFFFLCAMIQLVDRSGLTLAVDQPSIKEIRLLGLEITYYEATYGPLSTLQSVMGLLTAVYVLWSGARFYQSGNEKRARPLLMAMVVFLVCVVNDAAVGFGLYEFVYTIEYAYVGFVLVMAYALSGALSDALSVAQQRGQELNVARRQAEQATEAEREVREREQRAARQLRQAMREYIGFLERVTAGDYDARLALDEMERASTEAQELLMLGQHLNATVESMVAALDEMQAIQRRYAYEAWESFTRDHVVHSGFRYQTPLTSLGESSVERSGQVSLEGTEHDATVEPDDKAWLEPMTAALQDRDMVSDEHELALPITLRDVAIGVIGARREDIAGWSEDDVALARAITDQLAQTMESLRLLDETQRRATRERLTARIAAQVRSSTEVDTILRTAIQELGQGLRASDGLIRLGVGEGADSRPDAHT